ncbi:MAG: glycosyltransferase family 2 protein, partial [Planctomycetales bacterium]|nr:glycosyltransferase family 2 protein [Planctomycetales bacterium]
MASLPKYLTALPVFNEAQHLESVLNRVRQFSPEILVVDDGSSDGTAELLTRQTDLHVVTHPVNQGYGAALRSAFQFALSRDYDVLVTIDCDGQHEPERIPDLVAAMFPPSGELIDIVSGSRYLQQFDADSLPPEERRRINQTVTEMVNERLGLTLTDAFCGFKAYRVPTLRQLEITELGYAMPLQVWVQAVAQGWKIVEFPVPLIYLDASRSFGGSLDDANFRLAHYRAVFEHEVLRWFRCGEAALA